PCLPLPDGRQALPRPYGPVLGRLPRLPTKEAAWTDPYSHTPNSGKNLRKLAGIHTPIPKCKDARPWISLCENLRKSAGSQPQPSIPHPKILYHPSYASHSSSPDQSDCLLFLHFQTIPGPICHRSWVLLRCTDYSW